MGEYIETAYNHALTALLWSELICLPCDESEVSEHSHSEMEGRPFDDFFYESDIDGETDTLREQIDAFVTDNWNDLDGHVSAEQCGHDFILSRNGHGAGFWDRGLGERGKRLSESAKPFGECSLYLTDYDRVAVAA
jgi:hypothetical protein